MKKVFDAIFRFTVEIDCDAAAEAGEPYAELINEFVKEFLKHPQAAEIYYRNYFIDTYLSDCDELGMIKERLDYQKDYRNLFLEVAASCSTEVQGFIKYLYGEDASGFVIPLKPDGVRELLEGQFKALKVVAAEFKEIG